MSVRPFEFRWPEEAPPDDWITVTGGGLPQTIGVRVRAAQGQFHVIGLRIENSERITSATLRALPLGALADALRSQLRKRAVRLAEQTFDIEEVIRLGPSDLPPMTPKQQAANAELEALSDWVTELEADVGEDEITPASALARGRGAAQPTPADLRGFAAVFKEELIGAPRGALSRTSRRLGIHRSTTARWVEMCRRIGYLPPTGTDTEPTRQGD